MDKIKLGDVLTDRVHYSKIDDNYIYKLAKCIENKYPYKNLSVDNLEGEDWRTIKWLKEFQAQYTGKDERCKAYKAIECAMVSNKGRVKFIINGEEKIIPQEDDIEPGYLRLVGYLGFGYVYRLVVETWIADEIPPRIIVHHIDNDGYNNRVENLILVTSYQHGKIHANKNY